MTAPPEPNDTPGVYAPDAEGRTALVHLYQGGDYGLEDVFEIFQLGRLEPPQGDESLAVTLVLERRELRTLKTLADAYSFDHPQEFIEMCYEIQRFGEHLPADEIRFTANF